MPMTLLSHQALVMPLKMRWPRRFSGAALCIGSMVPDLEFIGRLRDDWIFSHTLTAQLWFTVPVTMFLLWLLTSLVTPMLLPFLRDHRQWRLHDLAALDVPRGWRGWSSVALSALIGGTSHVLLDGVTHGNHSGWLVPLMPFLRTMVPHVGGPVPLHDALQFWLTIVLAIATVFMWRSIASTRSLWQWRGIAVRSLAPHSRAEGIRVLALVVSGAFGGAWLGRTLHLSDGPKALAAGIAFGAIDGAAVAMVLLAVWLRVQRSRGARALAQRPTRDERRHATV